MDDEAWKQLRGRDNRWMLAISVCLIVFMVWGTRENDYLISSGYYVRLLHSLQGLR